MKKDKAFYMIITKELDYLYDLKNEFKFLGFPDRNKLAVQKMKPGDKIIVYVSKKSVFAAATEVTGNYFYSDNQAWSDPYEIWPNRIPTRPLYYFKDLNKAVYVKEIWDNLSLFKNKNKWGSQVQGSFRKITSDDYDNILNSIKMRAL